MKKQIKGLTIFVIACSILSSNNNLFGKPVRLSCVA